MERNSSLSIKAFAGIATLCSLFASCASRPPTAIDHRIYPKTPELPSSKITRGLAKCFPFSRDAAFWGNWGGSGNKGGAPIDEMDELFRRHDIVYYESRCGKHLKAADRALVDHLERIDVDTLEPEAALYRKRAIKFMNSPIALVVGKPMVVMLRKREWDGCYFTSPQVVEQFFEPDHPGFPYGDATLPGVATRGAILQTRQLPPVLLADS